MKTNYFSSFFSLELICRPPQLKNFLQKNYFILIFKIRKTQSFYESFFAIQNSISNRNLNKDDLPYEETEVDKKRADSKKELKNPINKIFTVNQFRNLKNQSPFFKHFKNIIIGWKRKIQNERCDENIETNIFYNPALFNLIQDYLYLIPLWTKVLLKKLKPELDFSNLSLHNNPVENYFDILKNKILETISWPSEICAKTYLRLEQKYNQFYKNKSNELSPNLTKQYPPDQDGLGDQNFNVEENENQNKQTKKLKLGNDNLNSNYKKIFSHYLILIIQFIFIIKILIIIFSTLRKKTLPMILKKCGEKIFQKILDQVFTKINVITMI